MQKAELSKKLWAKIIPVTCLYLVYYYNVHTLLTLASAKANRPYMFLSGACNLQVLGEEILLKMWVQKGF